MKIAYLVTLFPSWSETFILREILELNRLGRKVQIFSLKPASEKMVHSAAIKLQSATHYPRLLAVLRSSLYQIWQHPLKVSWILLELIAKGYRHPLMLAKTMAMFPVVLAFAGAMQTSGITHIHAHWATYPSTAAWIIRRLTGIPYSFTAHAHDIWLEKPYLREKIEAAETVVTISQYNVNYLAELYGQSIRRKFEVIHCGLEPTEFEPIEQNGEPGSKVVSVGRFGEIKGFEYLIRACRELRDRGRQVHCTLIGSGPLQSELRALSHDLGLDDQVNFAGALPQAEL
ncbi:MAG: glycosyltransferase, partial [Proteobacteria bacterium]|nr:glycosyltransferase [Pseudomonadota bacterium]